MGSGQVLKVCSVATGAAGWSPPGAGAYVCHTCSAQVCAPRPTHPPVASVKGDPFQSHSVGWAVLGIAKLSWCQDTLQICKWLLAVPASRATVLHSNPSCSLLPLGQASMAPEGWVASKTPRPLHAWSSVQIALMLSTQ